jgi:hypothetical protein
VEIRNVDRSLIRAGFLLFTLALLTGLAVPAFLNQRMGVTAHLTAVLSALLLIALGLVWGLLAMRPVQARLTRAALARIMSLSAEQGDSAAAREAYGRLAALWAEADPEMMPLVRDAGRAAGH